MSVRFFHQWGPIVGDVYHGRARSFGLLVIWYDPEFPDGKLFGISICNFAVEFHW